MRELLPFLSATMWKHPPRNPSQISEIGVQLATSSLHLIVLLSKGQLQSIITHARVSYPDECCGFLLGNNSNPRMVQRTIVARNEAEPSKNKRFRINPIEVYQASEEARRTKLELVGIYHSHPDAQVEPSHTDLEFAWPNFTYIVLSLENGEPRDVGAWALNPTGNAFMLEELRII